MGGEGEKEGNGRAIMPRREEGGEREWEKRVERERRGRGEKGERGGREGRKWDRERRERGEGGKKEVRGMGGGW